ncbi:MAG: helix-turn-helix transcriptional regulator [Synechococcales bacterium]|nr:helix-turn-helix transcriptional regulator [Synechococcales bacterium]
MTDEVTQWFLRFLRQIMHNKFYSANDKPLARSSAEFLCEGFEDIHLSSNKRHQAPLEKVVSNYIEGILLFDEQGSLLHVNQQAIAILQKITPCSDSAIELPQEIIHVKEFMLESRKLFPQENWLNNTMIYADCSTVLQVHARWTQGNYASQNYLLLRVEDQNQFVQSIAKEESRRLRLTPREQQVWLLYRANYTYKQIAVELAITPNTVKKHMKSILTKQRSLDEAAAPFCDG